MKKCLRSTAVALSLVLCLLSFASCANDAPKWPEGDPMLLGDRELVAYEAEKSFDYLWELAQTDSSSPAYGLVRDRYPGSPNMASSAAVGFALGAIPAAVENGWITRSEGETRVLGTLKTFENLESEHGFFYHFINMTSGKHMSGSEISVIDTALMLAGAITAGEYFGGQAKTKADALYAAVDWNWYTGVNNGKTQFRMGYDPIKGTFAGWWDYYAEQLVMYVLGAGAPNEDYRIDKRMLYDFARNKGAWGEGERFIYSWFGSLFTYQFSHCFVDFEGLVDEKGVDWYQNSVDASLAARQYCIDNAEQYATYGENSWGLTACDTPRGYGGSLGGQPSGMKNEKTQSEGTIAPSGAVGSIVFTPAESIAALRHYYSDVNLRTEKYGLRDSYNLARERAWYAPDVVGINKGLTALMCVNYLNDGIVTKNFMKNANIQSAMTRLGFTQKSAAAAA